MLTVDTQRAFIIPDDKRDDYFKMVDTTSGWIRRHSGRYDEAIDATNDPIVIFNLEYIPRDIWIYMNSKLKSIGAKEMTEELTL